jgi:hypothetical protein
MARVRPSRDCSARLRSSDSWVSERALSPSSLQRGTLQVCLRVEGLVV